MANPTFSNLTSGTDNVDRATYTTASVSPTANRLIFVSITAFDTSTTTPSTPAVTGNGITYDLVEDCLVDVAGSDRAGAWIFRGMSGSPSSGAISIAFSGIPTDGVLNACAWIVDQSSADVDTSGTNGSGAIGNTTFQDDDGTGTTASANITIGAANSGYAACGIQVSTPGTTARSSPAWTELADVAVSSTGIQTQYYAGGADTAVSATHASARSGIIGVEVKQASAAAPALPIIVQPPRRP